VTFLASILHYIYFARLTVNNATIRKLQNKAV